MTELMTTTKDNTKIVLTKETIASVRWKVPVTVTLTNKTELVFQNTQDLEALERLFKVIGII